MAILDEIARITQAKEDFKTKLIEKGVTVSDEELISDYPPKLDLIKGGANTSDATATANEIRKGFTAYIASGKVEGAIEDYDGAFEILSAEAEFIATPSLVYTLSSDGTYYIVGTNCTDLATLENYSTVGSAGSVGSGLDSTWGGGELYIPNKYNGLPVLGISSYAFKNITNITACYIQDGITHIGKEVLNGCYNVEKISLPFLGCYLTLPHVNAIRYPLSWIFGDITYENSYKATQRYLEGGNSGYYYGRIPNKLTKVVITGGCVESYMFYECKYLKEIILKGNIEYKLYVDTFSNSYSLIKLVLDKNEVLPLSTINAFQNCYHFFGKSHSTYNPTGAKDGYIYVPDNLVEDYKVATNWVTLASQIKPLSELGE